MIVPPVARHPLPVIARIPIPKPAPPEPTLPDSIIDMNRQLEASIHIQEAASRLGLRVSLRTLPSESPLTSRDRVSRPTSAGPASIFTEAEEPSVVEPYLSPKVLGSSRRPSVLNTARSNSQGGSRPGTSRRSYTASRDNEWDVTQTVDDAEPVIQVGDARLSEWLSRSRALNDSVADATLVTTTVNASTGSVLLADGGSLMSASFLSPNDSLMMDTMSAIPTTAAPQAVTESFHRSVKRAEERASVTSAANAWKQPGAASMSKITVANALLRPKSGSSLKSKRSEPLLHDSHDVSMSLTARLPSSDSVDGEREGPVGSLVASSAAPSNHRRALSNQAVGSGASDAVVKPLARKDSDDVTLVLPSPVVAPSSTARQLILTIPSTFQLTPTSSPANSSHLSPTASLLTSPIRPQRQRKERVLSPSPHRKAPITPSLPALAVVGRKKPTVTPPMRGVKQSTHHQLSPPRW